MPDLGIFIGKRGGCKRTFEYVQVFDMFLFRLSINANVVKTMHGGATSLYGKKLRFKAGTRDANVSTACLAPSSSPTFSARIAAAVLRLKGNIVRP